MQNHSVLYSIQVTELQILLCHHLSLASVLIVTVRYEMTTANIDHNNLLSYGTWGQRGIDLYGIVCIICLAIQKYRIKHSQVVSVVSISTLYVYVVINTILS